LLTNAIKYNRDHGTVHITLNSTDREAVLTVTDTGIGIEAADLKKVFERFYRADPSRSGARAGTGLGLAICREIVDIHGGHIDASSQPGVGATLTVRLPLTEKPRVG
jgi:signal transduction histidine kinase